MGARAGELTEGARGCAAVTARACLGSWCGDFISRLRWLAKVFETV